VLVKVARHAGISPEPRIVHQRPELIQELMWLPPRLGTTADGGDSAQKVLFTFYNDQLSRVVVSYDRRRTEGLTVEDLVEAISATYGVPTIPLVVPGVITATHRDRRGAGPARREEGEYPEYLVRHEGAENQWMKDPPE
jgi:hypothetical protein